MSERRIIEQVIFYFSYEEVLAALLAVASLPEEKHGKPRISAGLQKDSGLTLCYQRELKEPAP